PQLLPPMRVHLLALVTLTIISGAVKSQLPLEKELIRRAETAKTEVQKIAALGSLAEFYTIYLYHKKAENVLEQQLALSEIANDKSLIIKTLFNNGLDHVSTSSTKEAFDKALAFIEKGLMYARETGDIELEVQAYLKKAGLLRKRHQVDEALQQVNFAATISNGVLSDSLKAELMFESGDLFAAKQDYVAAFRIYNTAFDLAYKIKNVALQSTAYHKFAAIYRSLDNNEIAKQRLLESVQLNKNAKNTAGLMLDYFDLFRLEAKIEYLNKAIALADSLHSVKDQLFGKRLHFIYLYQKEKSSEKALQYLHNNPDLQLYFTNQGIPNYNIGSVYHYSGNFDSAIVYYVKDEAVISSRFPPNTQRLFFGELAECYKETGKTDLAISYFEKSLALGKTLEGINPTDTLAYSLSLLYAQKANYQKAYAYSNLWTDYQKASKSAAEQREVTLLEIDREAKKRTTDLAEKAKEEQRRRNLQYIGISMAVAFLFLVLIVVGMFPISKTTVKMLNFFSFICLFEFIILLIDNWLHHITHGELLKIWLAKIFIITALMPLHHWLEHLTIKFLSSNKLERLRQRISFRRIFHSPGKGVKKIESTLESSPLL
ncbi:MAG TPA: hypothetical protein VMR70_12885, partial [Flavisolibacter sp.]|nr:hypothetical protein [Flavisolibacter sp.]